MTTHLSRSDRWLFYGLLGWFLAVFSLSIAAYVQGTLYEMPLFVHGSADEQSYPVLDDSPFRETTDEWLPGDQLLRVDGMDMRGASTLVTQSTLVNQSSDGSLQLEVLRGGSRLGIELTVPQAQLLGASIVTAIAFALSGVIVFLGAVPSALTRYFFVASTMMGTNVSYFFGLSFELTLAWYPSYLLSGFLACVFGFKGIALFPNQSPPAGYWPKIWPWLFGLCVSAAAISMIVNLPIDAADAELPRFGLLVMCGCLIVWLTFRNYRRANNEGRAQLKWVLLGSFLFAIPIVFVSAIAAFSTGYSPLIRIIDLTIVAYPVCWMIAILGYRALDVDRVFSAVATYTISAGIAVLLIVGLLPNLASYLISSFNLEAQSVYLALSLIVCGALIPLHRALRPRIESRFFPERMRRESAAKALSARLALCDTEDALIETLRSGLAEMFGAGRVHTAPRAVQEYDGVVVELKPGVGETVTLHLEKKTSGDIYSDRDIETIEMLVGQGETQLIKMRNQMLTLQRRAAEQLAAEKSMFLASASHDLRQPMHALGLFSESLVERNRDARLDDLVQQVRRSTRSLDNMFNSILDLSKIDAGAVVPELGQVYVQLLFEELELEFSGAAQEKGLELVFVPSSAVVYSDSNLLARIMRNLVSNAIRYTDHGKVLVGCRYGHDRMRLQVLDTGRGIRNEDHERIFTPYARVDQHVAGGLGLGLSVVDKLCTLLGYALKLNSEEGAGTRFSMAVPTARPTLQRKATAISWEKKSSLAGLRVLAVDDDPAIRLGLGELLGSWDCQFVAKESLAETALWLEQCPSPADLLLIDLHLTERHEGLRVLDALFTRWGSVPALLITGDALAGACHWVAGVPVQVLNKPLSAEKLRTAMQDVLGHLEPTSRRTL